MTADDTKGVAGNVPTTGGPKREKEIPLIAQGLGVEIDQLENAISDLKDRLETYMVDPPGEVPSDATTMPTTIHGQQLQQFSHRIEAAKRNINEIFHRLEV